MQQSLSEFLTESRQILGMTPARISHHLGVHRTTYRRWKRGLCEPHADVYVIKETVKELLEKKRKRKQLVS